jgi:general secretion pathway protein D
MDRLLVWTPGSLMNRAGLPATSRTTFWIALFLFVAISCLCIPNLRAESASNFYKRGQAAEAREDYDAAYDNFQKALAKAPKDLRIRTAYLRVRVSASSFHMSKGRKLMQQGDDQGALAEFLHAAEIDPGNEAATQEIARVRAHQGEVAPRSPTMTPEQAAQQDEIDSMGSPIQLKPVSNEPLTLHMAEDAKTVYQAIGRAAGVNVLFDPDYTSKRVQVDLTNVSLLDALRIVGTMSGTFWRPITSNSIFVAQNTRPKRTELDEQAVQTFYLTNAWQQNDLNDVMTALRNVLTSIKVYGVASQNALVIRGTPDELQLAQKIINDLDKARPEVVVDIAIMEVSKNWERTLGLQWPTSAGVALQSTTSSSSTSSNCTTGSTDCTSSTTSTPTLYNLAHLTSNNFAVTVGTATANLLLTDSNTKVLQNPRLRATDSQKATMKIGERIPVATGSYQTGAATALVSSLVNTQFQYLDIGVNIEMTPTIHYDGDVTLKMKIEDSSEGSPVTISGVTEPIIIQKTSEQVIRLREGEVSILGGILEQQDSTSWSGIPGLSSIPILKYLFGSKDHTITDDELVFMLIPHVVRSQSLTAANLRPIDTGSGQSIELRHLPTDGPAAHASPVVQSAVLQSITGTYPGQTAAGAVPAALADLRKAAQGSGNATPPPQTNLGPTTTTPPSSVAPQANVPPAAPTAPGAGVSFIMNSPGPVAPGATFQLPIVVSGAKDVSAVPMQLQYDVDKLSLVSVALGDFLSRDGQVPGESHRDDGSGLLTLNASRPPGAAGVSGAGVVYMLTFQAKAAGSSTIAITRPGAVNSANQPVPARGSQITVQVK